MELLILKYSAILRAFLFEKIKDTRSQTDLSAILSEFSKSKQPIFKKSTGDIFLKN
jgi:hypothetical protein